MHYVSTRNPDTRLSAAQAIVQGLSRDGGLFLPEEIPQISLEDIKALSLLPYPARAAKLMKLYLDEFTEEELLRFAEKAYGAAKFDDPKAAPVKPLGENRYILELWHGPTCAFKDMALQMLPYLLTASLQKTGEHKKVCILVATSGDTGKAALEGFRDVDHTRILVFYPDGGVSEIQKLQMVSQEGKNVGVVVYKIVAKGALNNAKPGLYRWVLVNVPSAAAVSGDISGGSSSEPETPMDVNTDELDPKKGKLILADAVGVKFYVWKENKWEQEYDGKLPKLLKTEIAAKDGRYSHTERFPNAAEK